MLTVLVFILLFGALQALMLLAVLLMRKKVQLFHVFLSAYIVVLLLQVVFKVLSKTWLMHNVLQWYVLSYYLPFLYGPLALLFTHHYLHKTGWQWRQLLHFAPFGMYVVLYLGSIYYYLPGYLFYMMWAMPRMVLQLFSIAIYHYLAWRLIYNCKPGGIAFGRDKLLFLKTFTGISFSITCLVAWAMYFLYTRYPLQQDVRWAFIGLTLFVYWLSYKTLQQPSLFKVIQGNNTLNEQPYTIPALKVHRSAAKYANSGLKHEEAERIVQSLNKSIDAGKLFLDASLTIDILAEKLDCQKHHLSQVLNDRLQKSFAAFLNEKRVEEAKRILTSPAFEHYKIASIAYDAGFNSLSSFNEIFKKSEGLTPSAYRALANKQHQPQIKRV